MRIVGRFVLMTLAMVLMLAVVPANLDAQDDETLIVATWNLESGEADPDLIATQLGDLTQSEGIHVWGLSEVDPDDVATFEAGIEGNSGIDFISKPGSTGNDDSLVVVYDSDRLEFVETIELFDMNFGNNDLRAPLVVEFLDLETGEQFLFVVVHLARGNENRRHLQAQLLNEWASMQDIPVILSGDFNFDYDVDGSSRDEGFDFMTEDGVVAWVEPDELIRTQCSALEGGNTEDEQCRFNSVLDFIFVAGAALNWVGESEIIVQDGDFPDDLETSDHRPVIAEFLIIPAGDTGMSSGNGDGVVTRAMLLERIDSMETELTALRELVEMMEE